jgi:hypothetical protein
MPAQAGIQGKWRVERHKAWIPAFAGKTEKKTKSTSSRRQ